jgi:Ni/Fe-hydrogenase subunit HybB-like protein
MTTKARAVGGPLLTPAFKVLLVVWAAATAVGVVRFTHGLGAVTSMNDGYPWGLWIAFDVVVGTGLASGGYALALLVFVFNKGRYHPLVRPALLTSLLGYGVAGVAVVFDVGRWWGLAQVPVLPWRWNGTSVLLEVALCMMAYVGVLAVELAPVLLERWDAEGRGRRAERARRWLPRLQRALPFVIAVGLVLPTMHQSSLGALLLVASTKLHPLWHTGALPLLFLLTAFSMGYAVLYFESIFSSVAFGRPLETKLLGKLGAFVGATIVAFLLLRFATLVGSERVGLAFTSGTRSFFFWAETLLFAAAAWLFVQQWVHARASTQLQAALLAIAAGALYRIDAFLVAFDPGAGWHYFPSVGEIVVTLGFVATETMAYLFAVRRFPILAGVSLPARGPLPVAAPQEVVS